MNKSVNLVKVSWRIVTLVAVHKMAYLQHALWWHALGNVITQREVGMVKNETVLFDKRKDNTIWVKVIYSEW